MPVQSWKKVLLTNSGVTATADELSNQQHTWNDLSPAAIDYEANEGLVVTVPVGTQTKTALEVLLEVLDINGTTEPAVLRVDDSGHVGWGKGAPSNVIVGENVAGNATELANGVVPMGTTLTGGNGADNYSVMNSPISATIDSVAVAGSATVNGTLDVTGATTLSDTLTVSGSYATTLGGTLGVSGNTTLNNANFTIKNGSASNKFSVTAGSGNTGYP